MSDTNEKIKHKISQAKAKLLVDYPYFGTLASRLEFRQNDNIHAFLSDGSKFEYNDEYLADLDLDEVGFALSNAAMHTALAHDNRQKGRMSWLWQLATDHAINAMLVQNGLEAPLGINYEERFDGMYAEEIYAVLKEEIKNEEFDSNEENDTGFNENNKRHSSEQKQNPSQDKTGDKHSGIEADTVEKKISPESLEEEQWQKNLEEANEKYKDELPEGLERFYEIETAKIDWRSELYNAIDRHYYHDYSLVPPSKKLLYMGTYLPSLSSNMLRIVVAIDSSGSVDEELLGTFIAEFESILLSFATFEIDLLVCDDKIHSHQHFSSGDKLEYELKGSGGTDFRPVFDYIDDKIHDASLLLYFTDLEGKFPEFEPQLDTIWVSSSSSDVPFGRSILL